MASKFVESAQEVIIHDAQIDNVGRDQITYYNTIFKSPIRKEDHPILAILKPAKRSEYYHPRCMERTRESVFKDIYHWLDAPDKHSTPNIMWINGSPGTGKSAIASSLVSYLCSRDRLGSFFFFVRGDDNLSDPTVLWRTVAYDLARFHSCLNEAIIAFLRRPGYRDADIQLHFECMVMDALRKNHQRLSSAPPVIVLDALDECGSDDYHSAQRRILLETLTRWSRLPRLFKLIVTSRNDRVPESFYDPQICRKITLETGDSVRDETHDDIRAFLRQRLNSIKPMLGLSPWWPGDVAINQLAKRAAGLFIWAETALVFISEMRGNPTIKLQLVLSGDLGKQSEIIDNLYRNILNFSFKNCDEIAVSLFNAVAGAVIVAHVPLNINDLLHFLGIADEEGQRQLSAILYSLSSVIESDKVVRLRHISFAEFLCDRNRCRDRRFVVNQREQHYTLALACLRTMNADLRFNICKLESSYVRNDDVPNLSTRISACIPTRLSYACRYWAAHLCNMMCDETGRDVLLDEVRVFFSTRLLYWLEVMSLVKEIPASSMVLLMAAQWLEPFDVTLSEFARDSSRFIANFTTPISESVPHIYLSALPFSPRTSLISEQYLSQFPETLSIVAGRDEHWPALVNVLAGHRGSVFSVAYSPDGKHIVSGSADESLCVWNIETGHLTAGPFRGHTGTVHSVTYSPDGTRVISGSFDKTVRVWDIETGRSVSSPLDDHKGSIRSVACSPNGKRIVSGSDDKMLRVWNIETGSFVSGRSHKHTSFIYAVAYAPDGLSVVVGSSDGRLRVCNADTGDLLAGLFDSHRGPVHAVAYSPDGMRVVSGSSDSTVRVWNIETGRSEAGPFRGHTDSVNSVAYSPDANRVVSGSDDRTVCVWDVTTGQIVAGPFEGHTGPVRSVAYSPDGKRVVSGSSDQTIRVWDVATGHAAFGPLESNKGDVLSVAYSPDGKHIASGSHNSISVWEIENGNTVASQFKGHTGSVLSVVYSSDGARIISSSHDRTVSVWDVQTQATIAGPLRGHTGSVWSVTCSPDNKRIVSGSEDSTLCIWDVETRRMVAHPLKGHVGSVWSVAYSPDGKRVVSGSNDTTLCVWDVETGRVVSGPFIGHEGSVWSVAYSPDGKRVVSGSSDRTVRVWDVEMGKMVAGPFKGHSGFIHTVAYSPDGKRVVSGSADKTIRVWDVETGKDAANPFKGHTGPVHSVAYSPDGTHVLSGSADGTLCIWAVETAHIPDKRHLRTLDKIGGPEVFGSCRLWYSSGWAFNSIATSEQSGGTHRSILFWVPVHARPGLCDAQTLFVLGVPRTQLDLSRFVHGEKWTDCRTLGCDEVSRRSTWPCSSLTQVPYPCSSDFRTLQKLLFIIIFLIAMYLVKQMY